jgi:hypothetical protein
VKGTSAVLPDDHQGGQIAGGTEIKSGIDARSYRDLRLTSAGAPCGLIHEPGLRSYALVENQIAKSILACGHALRLLG